MIGTQQEISSRFSKLCPNPVIYPQKLFIHNQVDTDTLRPLLGDMIHNPHEPTGLLKRYCVAEAELMILSSAFHVQGIGIMSLHLVLRDFLSNLIPDSSLHCVVYGT